MYDPGYLLLMLVTSVVGMLASANVQNTFKKYSQMRISSGITGSQAAQRLLREADCSDTHIEHVGGELSDHFDPRANVVRLSDPVYASASVAAIGVAAHECGHVMQHHEGYGPIKIRNGMAPVVSLGSQISIPMILIGLAISGFDFLIPIGIAFYAVAVAFHVVTLPVELNASNRALRILEEQNYMNPEEIAGARKVLSAAAMTYLVAALASVATLFYFISRSKRRG